MRTIVRCGETYLDRTARAAVPVRKADLGRGFDGELATLPGAYAPRRGCLLVARSGDRSVGCVALRYLELSLW